jgi:ABC-type transport system involved in multi-copper enzyme maturation permease subunit
MNAQLRKEIRLLLPAWGAAMALGLVFFISFAGRGHVHINSAWFVFISEIGAVLLGVAVFGQELASGTLAGLLAHPVPRLRTWNLKMQVLAVAFVTSGALVVLVPYLKRWGNPDNSAWFCASMLAAAVTTGLWSTLLLRHLATAFWLTLLMPWFVVSMVQTARQLDRGISGVWETVALAVYSLAGYFIARRLFLQAQDTQWTGGTILLPTLPFPGRAGTADRSLLRRPLRALLWKEVHSHQSSLFFAGLLLVLHLAAIGIRKMGSTPVSPRDFGVSTILLNLVWMLWFAMPLIIGCETVAEERKMGTLVGQLCLPVRQGTQFIIKLAVAVVLGIALGGLFPALLEGLFRGNVLLPASFSLKMLLILCCSVSAVIVLLSILASSLSGSLMQAMGLAVVTMLVFSGVFLSALFRGPSLHLWSREVLLLIGCPILAPVVFVLIWRNYRQLSPRMEQMVHNLVVLAATTLLIFASAYLTWNRAWEWFMTLEPAHGPAQLHGSIRSKIIGDNVPAEILQFYHFSADRPFLGAILLPDGRLWGPIGRKREGEADNFLLPFTHGCFIGDSNWIDVVAGHFEMQVGLKSEGTLWRIEWKHTGNDFDCRVFTPIAEQIGTDSNWKRVWNIPWSTFVAMKSDGTFWWFGKLGDENEPRVPLPIKHGTELWRDVTNLLCLEDAVVSRQKERPKIGKLSDISKRFNVSSRHSDWIASDDSFENMFLIFALAADGTLCGWVKDSHNSFLGPSRKPVWSMNILDATIPAPVPAITNVPGVSDAEARTRKTQ